MEKRFESKLAERISMRTGRRFSVGEKLVVLAVFACAMFSFTAASVLTVIADRGVAGPAVPYVDIFTAQEDYVLYEYDADGNYVDYVHSTEAADDGTFAAKRIMTLKQATWESPGVPSEASYNKFVYTINVMLRDLRYFAPENVLVGDLLIPYTGTVAPTVVSASFAVNGIDVTLPEGTSAFTFLDDVAGSIHVVATLPDLSGTTQLDYIDFDMVTMGLMVKVPFYTDALVDATEDAWVGIPDIVIV